MLILIFFILSISICHSFIRIITFPQLGLLSAKRHFNLCLFQKFTSLSNNNKSLPKAVFIAGLNENYLDLIDDILYEVLYDIPPVIILSKDDANLDLSYFLYNLKTLNQRDHLIPSTTSTTSILPNLSYPIMILSGYDSNSTISIIRNFKKYTNASIADTSTGSDADASFQPDSDASITRSDGIPKIVFAIAVSPALKKPLYVLIDEILNDHKANNNA